MWGWILFTMRLTNKKLWNLMSEVLDIHVEMDFVYYVAE
jgi:hypothetical protein